MSDGIKISELEAVSSINDGCCMPMVSDGTTKKVTYATLCQKILSNFGDYIETRGASGNWTYEKYNSGVAKCWGNFTVNTSITTSNAGSYCSATQTLNYPFNFVAEPIKIMTVTIAGVWATIGIDNNLTHMQYRLNRVSQYTGTTTWGFYVEVIGRWK